MDENGNITMFEYNTTKGLLLKATDGKGMSTTYSYDSIDQLITVASGTKSNSMTYFKNC